MKGRCIIRLDINCICRLAIPIIAIFLISCGNRSQSNLSLPEGSRGDRVPLYPDAQRVTVSEKDMNVLLDDLLGGESLRYRSSTNISWTQDTGTKVQKHFDEMLPQANYRLESDWVGISQFRASGWRNGDVYVLVLYVDNLDSEQINDLSRLYGISGLQPGSSLIVTHVWDVMQPLPTATPTSTSTPPPTSTPAPTLTFTPTPLPTTTPTSTSTPTQTPTPTVTPLPGSLFIEDNFDDGNANGWLLTSGSWNVVNGGFICVADDGRAFVGEDYWTDYVVSAEIRPIAGRIDAGLIGRIQDEEHFYLAQLIDSNARIFRRNGRNWEMLTDIPYALEHNQVYSVTLEFRGTRINMYINNTLVTSVEDAAYLSGKAGLRCGAGAQVAFDNFSVKSPQIELGQTPVPTHSPGTTLIEDNFEDGNADGWLPSSGSWNVVNGEYICKASDGIAFIGEDYWTDYVVGAEIRPLSGRIDVGVVGRVQDLQHFYLAQLRDNSAKLYKQNKGQWERLTEVPYPLEYNQTYNVELEFQGIRISMYINGDLVTSVEDAAYLNGKAGLRCAAGAQVAFDNVSITTLTSR
jgi:hypothetical protein